jgi:putative hydrolase
MTSDHRACRWLGHISDWNADGAPPIDFQMHTTWTDGRASVSEMIEAAKAKAIALTEHVNAQSAWYPRFVAEVVAQREQEDDLEIYYGVEVAACDYRGGLKADLALHEAELVLGVVHRYPKKTGGFWSFDELTAADAVELEIRALTGLAGNRNIHVLGHPGGVAYKKYGAFPVGWLEPIFRTARDNGIAVELNTKYLWDLEGMLALLRRLDPLVSFGSDAHCAGEVGSNYDLLHADQLAHQKVG